MDTTWRWHQIEWPQPQPLIDLVIDMPGAEGYFSTHDALDVRRDPIDPVYYIGDAGHIRRVASQEDALAHPILLTPSPETVWRFDDPPRCRYVRIYHRHVDDQPSIVRGIFPCRLSSD